MRDLRLYFKLPMEHEDFQYEYWRPGWGTELPKGNFMIRDYGPKIMEIHNAETNAWFIINNKQINDFNKINFKEILDLVSIKPVLTVPYLIFGYERFK